MKKTKRILAVVLMLMMTVMAQAQKTTITGHVVDENGEPIFWNRDTNTLFGYQECVGDGNSQDQTHADEVTQRWWDMMADLMEVNADNSPVTTTMKEMFHLD